MTPLHAAANRVLRQAGVAVIGYSDPMHGNPFHTFHLSARSLTGEQQLGELSVRNAEFIKQEGGLGKIIQLETYTSAELEMSWLSEFQTWVAANAIERFDWRTPPEMAKLIDTIDPDSFAPMPGSHLVVSARGRFID